MTATTPGSRRSAGISMAHIAIGIREPTAREAALSCKERNAGSISWERLPGRRVPTEPIPDLAPDLAVEVVSESNTEEEMARKRREYFDAGVRLVWIVKPASRTVVVYRTPDQFTGLQAAQSLDGDAVLPGYILPLQDLFAELDQQGNG